MRSSRYLAYVIAICVTLFSVAYPVIAQPNIAPPAPAAAAVAAAPSIANIQPNPAKPGDTVTIAGAGFGASGTLKIGSATVPVPAGDWAAAYIKATVPDISTGTANVVVTPTGGAALFSTIEVVIPTLPIEVTPKVIQPANGKLPASMTLGIYEKKCDDNTGTDLSQGVSAPYTASITGAGLTLSSLRASKCSISANLAIDPNAAGSYTVFLYDQKGNQVGSADMGVLDSGAGPIPAGLNPQVDVMWEVMSQKNCKDAFGKRVSDSLYCVQIKIGNNSGHPLQVAGIGFTNKLMDLVALDSPEVTIANSSYASTRAVLVQAQIFSRRNVIANGLQAAGLIMAASTPFFSNSTDSLPKLHFTTLTNIVGNAALQAYNLIIPDPIVSQLKNLDDQSFRDSVIIANNSQAQTVVFVEKEALTLELQQLRAKLPNAAPAGQGQASSASSGGSSVDSPTKKTAWQQRLDETITNSKRPTFGKKKSDPLLVKLALGDVVIVGNQIEYLQRVQVQSNAGSTPGSTLSVQPGSLEFPDQTVATPSASQTVTFTNTGSTALSNLQFLPSGANKAEFKVSKNNCTSPVAPATPCTVDVVFTPDPTQGVAPPRKASLDASASSGSTLVSVPLSGNAKTPATPTLVISQNPLPFGTQKTGSPATATLTLVNFMGGQLTAFTIQTPPGGTNAADFTVSNNTCAATLAIGANCAVTWTFTAGATGSRSATVDINYTVNGVAQPKVTVTLSGTGS